MYAQVSISLSLSGAMPISVNKLHLFELSGGVIINSLKNIVKEEGYRGMYRGLSPTIIALLPNWAVSTTFYPAELCFFK